MIPTRETPARRRRGVLFAAAALCLTLSACAQGPSTATAPTVAAGQQSGTPAASTPASPSGSADASSTPVASAPSSSTTKPSTTKPSTTKPSTTKPSTAKASATKPASMLQRGAQGRKVRELQHRLRQIGWYTGAISGTYDATTVQDVKGFQGKRGLPRTGEVDATTWSRLTHMTRMPTHDEMYNILKPGKPIYQRGSQGTKVKELQARLKQIGWFFAKITGYYGTQTTASVKGFQAKRGIPVTGEVDQRTWDRLIGMTHTPTAAELSGKPAGSGSGSTAGLDPRCLTGRTMCISKTTDQLVWVVDGKPKLRFDVRFGAQASPTREGVFHVGWKAKDWVSTIYHSPMPFSMFFSGGQAVHYSSDFAARGYAGASHGCVNVRDYDGIAWLFGQVRVGDKVVVYR